MTSVASPFVATLPQGVDPTQLHLAYGRRAIPKLVSELHVPNSQPPVETSLETDGTAAAVQTNDKGSKADVASQRVSSEGVVPQLFERQRALVFLAALLRSPENIAQAVDADLVPKIATLVTDEDLTVRQKSTELLVHFAAHAVGRIAIVEHKLFPILATLFDDQDTLIRTNVHEVFVRVTSQKNCVLTLGEHQESTRGFPSESVLDTTKLKDVPDVPTGGLVPVLVAKACSENPDIQCLALQTLYNLIRFHEGFAIEALQVKAVTAFTALLTNRAARFPLKVAASRAIQALSFYRKGKTFACSEGTIPVLVGLLGDGKSEVRAAAAGALMSITVEIEAKRIMVRDSSSAPLITLLEDDSDSVKLNVIKTITNCAEDYRGRFAFQSCIKRLEDFYNSSNEQLGAAAKKAVEVITWRP